MPFSPQTVFPRLFSHIFGSLAPGDNKKFVVDYTMDELEEMLDPVRFFRISRAFFVSIESVDKIDEYFGHRLILSLRPMLDKEVTVSREKVTMFKKWMGK